MTEDRRLRCYLCGRRGAVVTGEGREQRIVCPISEREACLHLVAERARKERGHD